MISQNLFLWFDDDLFIKEREELEKHGVLENWIEVDIRKNEDALGIFLASFPIPVLRRFEFRQIIR